MWIEAKHMGKVVFINSALITLIDSDDELFRISIMGNNAAIQFTFDTLEEMKGYLEGFILALNGLDFISDDNYIKPLMQSKNEVLYRYMMLKEVLGERK